MANQNPPASMYIQLTNHLADAIAKGEYAVGDKLPSENTLCQQFGVSRITVRQALQRLSQQGLIYSVHGKGSFVKAPSVSNELDQIVSFSKVLEQKGLDGYTRVCNYSNPASDAAAYRHLGASVVSLDLLGYISKAPAVYYTSHFPADLGKKMLSAAQQAEQDGLAFSTYDLYKKIGVALSRVEQTIRAVNADAKLSEILNVPNGEALIVLESVYYGTDDAPLEHKISYYRADVYSFHIRRNV